MFSELYNVLKFLDPKPEEIADALWLANYAPSPEPVKGSQDERENSLDKLGDKPGFDPASQSNPTARGDLHPSTDNRHAESGQGIPARRFRAPGGMALHSQLDIVRALRPLKRTIASQTHFTIDIPATIKGIADRDEWIPILKSQRERWLDVALVVDEWSSMAIWYQTLKEFQNLIEASGVFRQIKIWGMYPESEQTEAEQTGSPQIGVRLHEGWGHGTKTHRTKSAKELINPSNDQLILMLSDCVSPAWRNGAVSKLLKAWYQTNTVVIFQMLPYTLWERTSLGYSASTWLTFPTPGAANNILKFEKEDTWFDDDPDAEESPTIAVPVVTFDHDLLLNCTKAIAGASQQWIRGYLLPIEGQNEIPTAPVQPQQPSAAQLVEIFQAVASRPAQRLAGYFSTMHTLTLAIMHTIQRVMMPDSTPGHLAEVFLSGLIERPDPVAVEDIHPYQIPYTFVPGVAVRLQATLLKSDITTALQKTLAEFIDQRTGQSLDFEALIADPTSTENLEILQRDEAFATVSVDLLYRLGGQYGELARNWETYKQSSVHEEIVSRSTIKDSDKVDISDKVSVHIEKDETDDSPDTEPEEETSQSVGYSTEPDIEPGLGYSAPDIGPSWDDVVPEKVEYERKHSDPNPLMNFANEIALFIQIASEIDMETRLVTITGESGSGKTCLLDEFMLLARQHDLDTLQIALDQQISVEKCLDDIVYRCGLARFPNYNAFRRAGHPEPLTRERVEEWYANLTHEFYTDLVTIPPNQRLCIFFDTYEKANALFKQWLVNRFLPSLKQQELVVVIAGQESISRQPSGFGQQHFLLEGVSLDSYRRYAQDCGLNLPNATLEIIHEVVNGRPKELVDFVQHQLATGISSQKVTVQSPAFDNNT